MTPRAGLFLDLDGTIAESLGVMQDAYFAFLNGYDCVPSMQEFSELNGPPLSDIVVQLKAKHGLEPSADVLLDSYRNLISGAYEAVAVMPGAQVLIRTAKLFGFKVAVVTSNSSALARHWLSLRGIDVDSILGCDDVVRGKPHPDLYLRALEETGCDGARSMAVEDSERGLTAALEAGIGTCFLYRGNGAGKFGKAEIVSHLDEVRKRIEREGF